MIIDLESLRALCADNTITLTDHAAIQLMNRQIKYTQVKTAIMTGEIIEEYPNDYPNPRILVLGYTVKNEPLHIVIGVGDWNLQIITAYHPSAEKWEQDYKTRKVRA